MEEGHEQEPQVVDGALEDGVVDGALEDVQNAVQEVDYAVAIVPQKRKYDTEINISEGDLLIVEEGHELSNAHWIWCSKLVQKKTEEGKIQDEMKSGRVPRSYLSFTKARTSGQYVQCKTCFRTATLKKMQHHFKKDCTDTICVKCKLCQQRTHHACSNYASNLNVDTGMLECPVCDDKKFNLTPEGRIKFRYHLKGHIRRSKQQDNLEKFNVNMTTNGDRITSITMISAMPETETEKSKTYNFKLERKKTVKAFLTCLWKYTESHDDDESAPPKVDDDDDESAPPKVDDDDDDDESAPSEVEIEPSRDPVKPVQVVLAPPKVKDDDDDESAPPEVEIEPSRDPVYPVQVVLAPPEVVYEPPRQDDPVVVRFQYGSLQSYLVEGRYKCPDCDKSYSRKDRLSQHFKKFHVFSQQDM